VNGCHIESRIVVKADDYREFVDGMDEKGRKIMGFLWDS
jgi:hypothetical protein